MRFLAAFHLLFCVCECSKAAQWVNLWGKVTAHTSLRKKLLLVEEKQYPLSVV